MYEVRAHPEFSWSVARHRTLCDCPRRYLYTYYTAHIGWLPEAEPDARAAYTLKQLVTLPMALGAAVHRRAVEVAAAVRARRRPPERAVLVRRTRQELNALCLASQDRDAFLRSPRRSPMLLEVYYQGRLTPAAVARASERLEQCLLTLEGCALWDDLRALPPTDVLVLDSPVTYQVHGVTVYAAPDLLYRADGGWTVVDFKTGRAADVLSQLAVYACYVEHGLGVPDAADRTSARVVSLAEARDETTPFAAEDLDAALEGVRDSVRLMRSYLADVPANVPKPRTAFPLAPSPARCATCQFLELCRSELPADVLGAFAPAEDLRYEGMLARRAGDERSRTGIATPGGEAT